MTENGLVVNSNNSPENIMNTSSYSLSDIADNSLISMTLSDVPVDLVSNAIINDPQVRNTFF